MRKRKWGLTLDTKRFWYLYFCLSVCVSSDSAGRNYPNCFKFHTILVMFCEISCIVFWYALPKLCVYRNTQKYLNTLRPMLENVFEFLSLCVWRDNGHWNYPQITELRENVYMLRKVNCTVFGVRSPKNACTGTHKSVSIYSDLWKEIL